MEYEQSDHISCNTRAYLGWNHTRMNDEIFLRNIRGTGQSRIRDVEEESKLQKEIFKSKEYLCTPMINQRGGNAMPCAGDDRLKQGYNNFTAYHLSEYLMVPCKKNTFRNFVDCDEDRCCSVSHQLFNNMTKRK